MGLKVGQQQNFIAIVKRGGFLDGHVERDNGPLALVDIAKIHSSVDPVKRGSERLIEKDRPLEGV